MMQSVSQNSWANTLIFCLVLWQGVWVLRGTIQAESLALPNESREREESRGEHDRDAVEKDEVLRDSHSLGRRSWPRADGRQSRARQVLASERACSGSSNVVQFSQGIKNRVPLRC